METFYFAYGSNLLSSRIRIRVKSAQKVSVGQLSGFALSFSGYSAVWKGATANIVPDNKSVVVGVVWRIAESDLVHLDAQEQGYRPIEVDVRVGDRLLKCRTYVQLSPNELGEPSFAYKLVIVKGAIEHHIDDEYVERIRKIPDNGIRDCALPQLVVDDCVSDH